MKSIDFWALLILSSMPEKPLQLEGVWRSCEKISDFEELEYLAYFKKDELIEDYFGSGPDDGNCGGKRIIHFRRIWKLKFNNFNFVKEYKKSSYIFQAGKGAPNWYGCFHFRARDTKTAEICHLHEMLVYHDLKIRNESSYLIKGETLQINFKGHRNYLKRVEFPNLLKFKNYLLDFYYSKITPDNY